MKDLNFECLGLLANSTEGKAVIQKLDQTSIPAVLIIKLNKEQNISDIKFLLDGQNLIHDNGQEYILFLRQALSEFRV
jgi:hypothetical protein